MTHPETPRPYVLDFAEPMLADLDLWTPGIPVSAASSFSASAPGAILAILSMWHLANLGNSGDFANLGNVPRKEPTHAVQ